MRTQLELESKRIAELFGVAGRLDMDASLHRQIETIIKRLLATELNVSAAVLETMTLTTPLLGRGIGLDSTETVALITGLEEEFGISVPDTDLTADLFETVGTLTEYVLQNIPGK